MVHPVVHPVVHPAPAPIKRPATAVHAIHGVATWYDWHPGQCASPTLAKGTRVWITSLQTGKTITCLVTDRQGYAPGRVVDLSTTDFSLLAPPSQGVIPVVVSW
jgi:rare lipoprotein A (peptidoglycan hydrolase)